MGLQLKKPIIFAYISTILLFCSLLGCHREKQPPSETSSYSSEPSQTPPTSPTPTLKSRTIHTSAQVSAVASRPIVAIHGLGDTPSHFSQIFDAAPFSAVVILPQAPTPYGTGYSWFPVAIPVRSANSTALKKDVLSAANQLCAFIHESNFEKKPVITGFSQGGILAFSTAVTCPSDIHASIPVAGFLPLTIPDSLRDIPPITAFHGTEDGIIESVKARESIAQLQQRGFHAKLVEYPNVGHTISPDMQQELMRTLGSYL
ncbi:MAG: dienelactone hydrolase family protein [Deltaproteobacteria bacterium]|nr:dienelactone hydrolase family protein [Deltaproteobacteria bacterium]MBN2670399.1 dienelactone hydrolase family protein [Deltaproteobacteria bacterium]